MFVVAMTLSVLGAVGIYALAAASNEVRTSGNERQNTQTHYLSQYGVIGTTHEMIASKAQFYIGLMMSSPETTCVALPGVNQATAAPITKACRRLGSAELGAPWTASPITIPYGGAQPYQNGIVPGSFGPIPLKGDFFVEMTEPTKAHAAARYATDLSFCFIRLTVTSNGITQPVLAAGQTTATYGNMGVEVQRARVVAGPVQCPR